MAGAEYPVVVSDFVAIVDRDGHYVNVSEDGGVYRLLVDAIINTGGTGLSSLAIQDGAGSGRLAGVDENNQLKVVTHNIAITEDLSSFVDFDLSNGTTTSLIIDGSLVNETFIYNPPASKLARLNELRIVFASDEFKWEADKFGKENGLVNGLLMTIRSQGVVSTLRVIKDNFDLLKFASAGGVYDINAAKDVIIISLNFGGVVKLNDATSDYISIVVRDDLDKGSFKNLTATLKAVEGDE